MRLEIQRRDRVESRRVNSIGEVDGECPGCGAEQFHVARVTPIERKDGVLRCGAKCTKCHDSVGYVYDEPNTIFGAEEDRAILEFGRARVYR